MDRGFVRERPLPVALARGRTGGVEPVLPGRPRHPGRSRSPEDVGLGVLLPGPQPFALRVPGRDGQRRRRHSEQRAPPGPDGGAPRLSGFAEDRAGRSDRGIVDLDGPERRRERLRGPGSSARPAARDLVGLPGRHGECEGDRARGGEVRVQRGRPQRTRHDLGEPRPPLQVDRFPAQGAGRGAAGRSDRPGRGTRAGLHPRPTDLGGQRYRRGSLPRQLEAGRRRMVLPGSARRHELRHPGGVDGGRSLALPRARPLGRSRRSRRQLRVARPRPGPEGPDRVFRRCRRFHHGGPEVDRRGGERALLLRRRQARRRRLGDDRRRTAPRQRVGARGPPGPWRRVRVPRLRVERPGPALQRRSRSHDAAGGALQPGGGGRGRDRRPSGVEGRLGRRGSLRRLLSRQRRERVDSAPAARGRRRNNARRRRSGG